MSLEENTIGYQASRPSIVGTNSGRLWAYPLFKALQSLAIGRLTVSLPDGRTLAFGQGQHAPSADIQIHSPSFFRRVAFGGDIGFAESYMDGQWSTSSINDLIQLVIENETALKDYGRGKHLLRSLTRLRHLFNRNTRHGSRRNIQYHYDLGNEFYRLWLDRSMTYSAALFDGDLDQSLADAQNAKYRTIIEMAELKPGHRALEIGCGWGAFAEKAAKAGVDVDGITLSERQLAYAQTRLSNAALSDRATLSLTDYRDTQGTYDAVVSIEMFEAVGEEYWKTYFDTLKQRLKPGAPAVLQIITIDEARFERYRTGADFIQRYIFPGGMLPAPSRVSQLARESGLTVESTRFFGRDYAETLKRWNVRFQEKWPLIQALGYDLRFKRLWEYYLGYCEAGFREGTIDVGLFKLRNDG